MIKKEDIRIDKSIQKIISILTPGEELKEIAIQHRLFALINRRQILVATTGRLIWMKRNLIIGFKIIDFRWQDISEIIYYEGIFGADLTVKFFKQEDLSLNSNTNIINKIIGFVKNETKLIYKFAQEQDNNWREKRRIRSLEELKAKSGGITLNETNNSNSNSNLINLEKNILHIQNLKEKGFINDSEFENLKAKYLNQYLC